MGRELERLEVVIEADSKKLKQGAGEAKQTVKSMIESINHDVERIKSPLRNMVDSETRGQLNNMRNLIKRTFSDLKTGDFGSGIAKGLRQYVKEAQMAAGLRVYSGDYEELQQDIEGAEKALAKLQAKQDAMSGPDMWEETEDYKELTKCIATTERRLNSLIAKQDKMKASGAGHNNRSWKNLMYDIDETKNSLDAYKADVENMRADGSNVRHTQAWEGIAASIRRAKAELESYKLKASAMKARGTDTVPAGGKMSSGSYVQSAAASISHVPAKMKEIRASVRQTVKSIPLIGRAATESSFIASKAFKGMRAALGRITPAIRKVSGVFGALLQKFKSGIPILNRAGKAASGMGGQMKGLGGLFRTVGMTAKFMFASFLIGGAVNGAKEGMKNLSQYSNETNASLSMLMSSLTQLKNALAAAFAPIFNAVAPALNVLIQLVSKAANAIGQLFSALTGKRYAVQATKVNQNFAESLSDNAGAADKANKANKNLQKTLMGFDQINKLDSNNESSEGGSGGVGAGGLSPSDMFETVEVGSGIRNLADKIKEAWRTADFTEIGAMVGNKLNQALSNIPWDKIRGTSRKIAKSIATFLNGFVAATDWKLVGSTLGNSINTAIDFAYTFVTTFDWKKFGRSISGFINGAIETIEWSKLGATISGAVKGILDFFIQAIENVNWFQVGQSIKDMLVSIDYAGIVSRFCELFGAALGGIAAFIGGLIGDAVIGAQEYFRDKIEECGGSVVKGIFKGIGDAIVNVGQWIYDNIFSPFIEGFKKAFGIHSPSTVMAEQGSYIIQGMLKGLVDNVSSVITWFAELPGKVKNALGNAKDWLVEKGKDAIEGIKNGYEAVKDSNLLANVRNLKNDTFTAIGNIVQKVKSKGGDIITGIKNGYDNGKVKIITAVSDVPTLISKGIGSLWEIGKNAISSLIKGFTSMDIPTPHFEASGHVKIAGVTTPIPKLSVKWYASGGFPGVGEMFVARENGPELVGRMGSRSAVANNSQIVDGVKAGVKEAVIEAMMMFSSGGGSGEAPVIELTIVSDTETLYRAVLKGKKKTDRRYEATVSV